MNFQPFQLRKINILLGGATALLILLACSFQLGASNKGPIEPPPPEKTVLKILPKSFRLEDKAYVAFGEPLLSVQSSAPIQKLPDLRPLIISYGITCRPDCEAADSQILIGIRGQREHEAVRLNEHVYLRYDSKSHLNRWQISPNNAPTPIWIELERVDSQVVAHLKMKNAQGEFILEPYEAGHFILPEMAPPLSQEVLSKWRVGGLNVDTTILTRQRAEWHGQDLFLDMYGGDEFAHTKNAERINFDEEGRSYSVFVRANDMLVYDESGWHIPENREDSKGKPLLFIKKIQDGVIYFDLWENEGKMKLPLELRRIPLPEYRPLPLDIKLVGARSKRDWIAQIASKRELLRADDWLLIHQGQYRRLTKPEELDDYVQGVLKGDLVVLDGVKRVNNEMCLTGLEFNESRTQYVPVAIPLYKHETPPSIMKNEAGNEDDMDDDDDDFDDDDDIDDEPFVKAPGQVHLTPGVASNGHGKRASRMDDRDEDFDEDDDEDIDDFV